MCGNGYVFGVGAAVGQAEDGVVDLEGLADGGTERIDGAGKLDA